VEYFCLVEVFFVCLYWLVFGFVIGVLLLGKTFVVLLCFHV